jgi:hypothetical protein
MQMNYDAANVTNIKKMSDILSQEQNKKFAILVSQFKQHQIVNALFASSTFALTIIHLHVLSGLLATIKE